MTWHADQSLLLRYRDGGLSSAGCSSVEAHLVACAQCRDAVAQIAPPPDSDAAWGRIVATISAPEPGWLERVLRRAGLSEALARLVGVTPSLQRPWLLGVVLTVLLSVLFSHVADSQAMGLMMIAPLLPVAGVAVAFGPGVDPTYELLVAAPIRGFDVLIARAAAVLATTIPITAVASVALPLAGWEAVAWLLPALALTALTMAAGTWFVPWKAALVLCGCWIAPIAAQGVGLRRDPNLLDAIAGPTGQLTMLVLLAGSTAVVVLRRSSFDLEVVR